MGIKPSRKQIVAITYAFSARARTQQRDHSQFIGQTSGVSTDGGRVRIRTDRRGKRTKEGRRRYRTDW